MINKFEFVEVIQEYAEEVKLPYLLCNIQREDAEITQQINQKRKEEYNKLSEKEEENNPIVLLPYDSIVKIEFVECRNSKLDSHPVLTDFV